MKLEPVNSKTGVHLIVDSTGLSIVGEGEWAAAKHGNRGKRGWRKLHIGVDPSCPKTRSWPNHCGDGRLRVPTIGLCEPRTTHCKPSS
ncbi:MAG: hypothetical protein ACI835_005540 [Planctomycetota bacterium]